MKVTYENCQTAPDRAPLDALLAEYYALMIARIEDMGGTVPEGGERATQEFWDEVDKFLPPLGRLYLAWSDRGQLLGCGSLKSVGAGKGELKRLFVRPEARGLGVGRRLVDLRLDAAREMGMTTLVVDTLRNNVEMRGLYATLGFQEIEFYEESSTYRMAPELAPYMIYYTMTL